VSKQDNIAAQQQFGDAVNSGHFEAFRELMTPDVVDHDPAPDQGPGVQGFIDFFTGFRAAFPDLHIEVEHLVADEESVAFAYTVTGTHQGDFLGVPATGRPITARGVQISRFENGKTVERWGSSDVLGIMQQIGAVA